jgi:hypothetical protein
VDLFIHVVEKREGSGENENVDRRQQAQERDDAVLARPRDSGSQVGIGFAQNIFGQLKPPSLKNKFGFRQIYRWNQLYLLKKNRPVRCDFLNQHKPDQAGQRVTSLLFFPMKLKALSDL